MNTVLRIDTVAMLKIIVRLTVKFRMCVYNLDQWPQDMWYIID